MNIKKRNIKTFVQQFFENTKFLDRKKKFYLFLLVPTNILLTLLDFLVIGALAFLLSILLKPEWSKSKPIFQKIYQLLDFSNYNYFILFLGICSIIFFVLSASAQYITQILQLKLRQILVISFLTIIMKNILKSPYEWFLQQNTGTFMVAARKQAADISNFMGLILSIFINSFSLLAVFIFLLIKDPILCLIFLLFIGTASVVINRIIKDRLYILGKKTNFLQQSSNLLTRQSLAGIIDIKNPPPRKFI